MTEWESYFKNPQPLKVYVLHTGYVHMSGNIHFNKKSPKFKTLPKDNRFNPVFSFLVQHPVRGRLLLDTGLHPSFARSSHGNFGRLLGSMVKTKAEPGQDVVSQMKKIGLEPKDVGLVILSHLHLDHPSSLPEFRDVAGLTVFAGQPELDILRGAFGLFKGYLKGHLAGLDVRPIAFDLSLPPFDRVWDVFRDGSVLVLSTPGHTPGHVSALINARGGPILLTFDAAHRRANLTEDVPPIGDYPQASQSLRHIKAFLERYPHTRTFFAHDPDQLKELKLCPQYYD
ncbi:MAG: N-acyl homoserine lactonase family protein [Thermodesulfobacteriota bacterium]